MFEPHVILNDLEFSEAQIHEYEKEPVETGKILFYGSSTFTRWAPFRGMRPLSEDIRKKDGSAIAINHAFGTSTTEELLYYYPRLICPWRPSVLVLTTGLNDFSRGYELAETKALLERLFAYARYDMPGLSIRMTDIRPILKHKYDNDSFYFDHVARFNEMADSFEKEYDNFRLIRHRTCPLFYEAPEYTGQYSRLRGDIFVEDQVHYNQTGYDLYREFFTAELDEFL